MHGIFSNLSARAQDLQAKAQAAAASATTGGAGTHHEGQQHAGAGGAGGLTSGLSQNPHVSSLTHQLRTFQQKHIPVGAGSAPAVRGLQIGITAQKGIALDHDSISRDLTILAKETDEWVKDLPMIDLGGGSSPAEAGKARTDGVSIFGAPCTATLLNLTNQLSSLHKLLSTRLMDARAPLKSLRDLELEIESRQTKIKELDAQNRKKPQEQVVSQMEAIGAEIRELSLGLNEKRADAVKEGQERIWEAYGEFARNLACLSHAASILTPMLPTPTTASRLSPTQSVNTYHKLTAGEQMERTRGVEEGVRRTLGGLEGGWLVKIDDGGLHSRNQHGSGASTPALLRRQSSISSNLPPSIPTYMVDEAVSPKLQPDIIGAYPSSHLGLNDTPAPIPHRSSSISSGSGIPARSHHHHHSSFDRPIVTSPVQVDTKDSPLSGSAVAEDVTMDPVEVPHPTIAETGIPIMDADPGPSSGQLPRRDPPKSPEHIVKLGSFGSADAPGAPVPKPSSGVLPPTYEASGREQAEAQLRAKGSLPHADEAGSSSGAGPALPPRPLSKEEEAQGDRLPDY